MNISNYVKAGYSIIYVETQEIKRAVNHITENGIIINDNKIPIFYWNFVDGIEVGANSTAQQNPLEAIQFTKKMPDMSVIILENFGYFFESIEIVQTILNLIDSWKEKMITLVIVGESIKIPGVIEKLVTKIEFELPTIEEFYTVAQDLCKQADVEFLPEIVDYCKGLSMEEGENVLALSIIENGRLDKDTILKLKREIIKSTGFMDYMEPEPLENLGGLDNLKDYILERKRAWEPGSKLPKIRNIFLYGVPGTGKSLTAKTISSIMDWPLIRLDIGSMKGSLVGETEKNIRKATKIIDASGKTVVFVDR